MGKGHLCKSVTETISLNRKHEAAETEKKGWKGRRRKIWGCDEAPGEGEDMTRENGRQCCRGGERESSLQAQYWGRGRGVREQEDRRDKR